MISREQFISYLKHPSKLNEDTLFDFKVIVNDYPYFQVARMLYLRNLKNINSYRFESELHKHAVFISNRKMLYRLLNEPLQEEKEFELLPFDKDAFESFFNDDFDGENDKLSLSDTPVYDLKKTIAQEEQKRRRSYDDLIDRFVDENPGTIRGKNAEKHKQEEEKTDVVALGDSLITDTLAGIYVKQGLYREALSAYEKLSLKFPEKNSYFVAQIEKVKKLLSKDL